VKDSSLVGICTDTDESYLPLIQLLLLLCGFAQVTFCQRSGRTKLNAKVSLIRSLIFIIVVMTYVCLFFCDKTTKYTTVDSIWQLSEWLVV